MDPKTTPLAFSDLRTINVDQAVLRAHVMRPAHVIDVISDPFRAGIQRPQFSFTFTPGALYHLDITGFGDTLHAALQDQVAGYVVRLQQGNGFVYTRTWNWAQTASDGSESWTPDVRMHVASCSKLITAIAMTRILNE